jgi:hypothetical protein
MRPTAAMCATPCQEASFSCSFARPMLQTTHADVSCCPCAEHASNLSCGNSQWYLLNNTVHYHVRKWRSRSAFGPPPPQRNMQSRSIPRARYAPHFQGSMLLSDSRRCVQLCGSERCGFAAPQRYAIFQTLLLKRGPPNSGALNQPSSDPGSVHSECSSTALLPGFDPNADRGKNRNLAFWGVPFQRSDFSCASLTTCGLPMPSLCDHTLYSSVMEWQLYVKELPVQGQGTSPFGLSTRCRGVARPEMAV